MPKQAPKTAKKATAKPTNSKLIAWFKRHKLDTAVVTALVAVSAVVSGMNMTGYPQRFEDEGTYVSQAYALQERGTLTHYTYWYDHPPAGWMQMALHLGATNALDRYDSSIVAGREFMVFMHVLVVALIYALARRLRVGVVAAAIGTLAYALSPLTIEFSRYVLLDNVALPWLLGAFLLALSPRKHVVTALASAACMAIAVLSKETFVLLLPVLIYALWRSSDARNRRYQLASFGVVFVMIGAIYALYAGLKSELFPGEGHVSLFGTLAWQLFGREGSGSIIDASSGSRGLAEYWLSIDYWLLLIGALSLPFAFFVRHLRVAAFGLLLGLLLLLRTGYLPYPYVVILLPFAALVFAGVLDQFIIKPLCKKGISVSRIAAGFAATLLLATTAAVVAPDWGKGIHAITTKDHDASSRQAVDWVTKNINPSNQLVVESTFWTDLVKQGFDKPDPVWLYKTETDPEVMEKLGGWRGIDYVMLNGPSISGKDFEKTFPTVNKALDNAELVKEFGQDNQKVLIYKVQK